MSSPAALAVEPWHLPGWSARAIVEIRTPSSEPGVDTVGVKILCQGRGKIDGSDYRVLDTTGKAVPFQIMFHDAGRYSLLSFRAVDPRQKYYVYFGNPQARRAAEEIVLDPSPGAGPPSGAWIPHYGLVYATMDRPPGPNPKIVAELKTLLEQSKSKHGARYQRRIADGYNPFGSSDYYMSVYRGWIRIPRAGPYQFCTISNEASFSFLDGKELVHWPGRHTVERGVHGEKNARVDLTAGLHYIEYYHEEVTLEQMAYLGWRPSGDKGPFSAIPEEIYTAPHAAVVTRYEDHHGTILSFEPIILDTIWPKNRLGQYTRCRFQVGGDAQPGLAYVWNFGDGVTAHGSEVEHVFTSLGQFEIQLTTRSAGRPVNANWPLQIYEMQHVTDEIKQGQLSDYAAIVKRYDRAKLSARTLQESAHLEAEGGDCTAAIASARAYLDRFGSVPAPAVGEMSRLLADCLVRTGLEEDGPGRFDEAVHLYRASLESTALPGEKLQILAQLERIYASELDQPQKAAEILSEASDVFKRARVNEDTRYAFRKVLLAAGDGQLWHNKTEAARLAYERAESLSGHAIPAQVRAARIGAYPQSLREEIEAGQLDAALDIVQRWEDTFPTEKLKGQSAFWRGKVLLQQNQLRPALRALTLAVRLTVGSDVEPEARWLLGAALEKSGQISAARKEWARLVATGISDEFTARARAKLKSNP